GGKIIKWRIFGGKDRQSQAKQSSLLSIHSSCGSHFELSFCFSILYLSLLNILNHWPFPFFLNFAFRSQGACPSIARKIESQSIRTRLALIDS
uniref:Uncharacterized protein n=1 Tax=Amphimedon queenslandica TaxID=400682 RepID=A0A1X7UF65_AMPQE